MEENSRRKLRQNSANTALKAVLPVLENVSEWNNENIHKALFDLIASMEVKNGYILWPVRTAVSGKQFTPGGAVELCEIIGKEESIARIKKGIEKLS